MINTLATHHLDSRKFPSSTTTTYKSFSGIMAFWKTPTALLAWRFITMACGLPGKRAHPLPIWQQRPLQHTYICCSICFAPDCETKNCLTPSAMEMCGKWALLPSSLEDYLVQEARKLCAQVVVKYDALGPETGHEYDTRSYSCPVIYWVWNNMLRTSACASRLHVCWCGNMY